MFEGFRRGKGLEKALRAYLQEREGELAELEEGNNLPEFEIASPSEWSGCRLTIATIDPARDRRGSWDDDIPF